MSPTRNCTTPKSEVLTETVCRLFNVQCKTRYSIFHVNLKVTKFENPQISSAPVQKATKVSSKRYGTAPSANGAQQCLQVGSTKCSATMRSGQQHYFEPQGPEVCTSIYVLWMNLCTLLVSICVCHPLAFVWTQPECIPAQQCFQTVSQSKW